MQLKLSRSNDVENHRTPVSCDLLGAALQLEDSESFPSDLHVYSNSG